MQKADTEVRGRQAEAFVRGEEGALVGPACREVVEHGESEGGATCQHDELVSIPFSLLERFIAARNSYLPFGVSAPPASVSALRLPKGP